MKTINAKVLTQHLKQLGRPAGWRDLAIAFDVTNATERRDLRTLLAGMVRTGELGKDHAGAYHLLAGGQSQTGLIERAGKGLTFAGLPLERDRRTWLRAGDEVEARISDGEVHVLKVLNRSQAPLIGVVRSKGRYAYVESLSSDYRGRIDLIDAEAAPPEGTTVSVAVVSEEGRNLQGRINESLGAGGGVEQAVETWLASESVPTEWPDGVEAQVAKLPGRVDAGRFPQRRSLVDLPLVTIDGETARDFDDAVYAEARRGGWRLIVAIADVAHYVKSGSALDLSALERGNSVYLPDRVVPMLPEALSNELCSLKPKVPRLTMVCEMQISARGRITKFEFYEAVIRSWQRLTYERVQEFLDSHLLDVEPEVTHSLEALEAAYHALRSAREERGALDFETHECRLELGEGRVVAIHPVHRLQAHLLIEEAMIAANIAAASFLEQASRHGLYRVHERPDVERMERMRQTLASAGLRQPKGNLTPLMVQQALTQLGSRPDGWVFEMIVLRCLTQAVYSPENGGHFGLALERYMHFTSPIRRYADLVVHRAIKAVLHSESPPLGMDQLVSVGEHISMTERRAEAVGWGVDAWLKCEYVAGRVGETFDGVIMGVTEFGLFVELKGFFVQGLVHISELGSDYFQFHSDSMSLVGERNGRRFRLGDTISVVLQDALPEQGKLTLVPAESAGAGRKPSGGRKGKPGNRPGKKTEQKKGGRRRKERAR